MFIILIILFDIIMVFWLISTVIEVVAKIIIGAPGSGNQINFGNDAVIGHYDKYVWNPQYNPNNT